jgi:hypothetical protein
MVVSNCIRKCWSASGSGSGVNEVLSRKSGSGSGANKVLPQKCGSGSGVNEVLSRKSSQFLVEKITENVTGVDIVRSGSELGIFRVQIRSFNACVNCFFRLRIEKESRHFGR